MAGHQEDLVAENDLPNAREEEPTSTERPPTPKSVVSRRIEKVNLSDFVSPVVKAQGTVDFVFPYPELVPSELLLKNLNGRAISRAKKEVTDSPSIPKSRASSAFTKTSEVSARLSAGISRDRRDIAKSDTGLEGSDTIPKDQSSSASARSSKIKDEIKEERDVDSESNREMKIERVRGLTSSSLGSSRRSLKNMTSTAAVSTSSIIDTGLRRSDRRANLTPKMRERLASGAAGIIVRDKPKIAAKPNSAMAIRENLMNRRTVKVRRIPSPDSTAIVIEQQSPGISSDKIVPETTSVDRKHVVASGMSINTRGSEAQGSSRNATDTSPFTPPVAKKSREEILHEKNEQRNTSFTELRGPRANTQMVIRNLSYSFDKRQSPMTPSPLVAHDTDDCVFIAHYTSTPRGTIISATSLGDDRIEKSSHPLLLGIYVCPEKYPNEFMVVWSVSLEEDLLQAMSEVADKAILCVQKVTMEDLFNLKTKQKELLSRSQKITFNMLDDNNVCKQWTVISFGNIPTGLEDQLFRSFADVEKIFEGHARRRGKTLHNIMRCDGLFPLLSQQLQKKITGFNQ